MVIKKIKAEDLYWTEKSYGYRCDVGRVRLFVHTLEFARFDFNVDFQGRYESLIDAQELSRHEKEGVRAIYGTADSLKQAKNQAVLAANMLGKFLRAPPKMKRKKTLARCYVEYRPGERCDKPLLHGGKCGSTGKTFSMKILKKNQKAKRKFEKELKKLMKPEPGDEYGI